MKKKISVLHVVSSFNNSEGGPPIAINNIAYALRNKQFKNNLITTSTEHIKNKNFTSIIRGELLTKKFYFPTLLTIFNLWKNIKKNKIIHIHNYWNFVVFLALQFAIIHNKKIIITPHGSFDKFNIKKSYLKKLIFYNLIGKYQIKKVSSIHYLNKNEKKNSFIIKTINSKLYILSNYVDLINIKRKKIILKKKKINFTYLGRLDTIKNIEYQIYLINELIKINKNIFFHIIGPNQNNYKKKLLNLINRLKISNYIKFYKPIYNEKKYSWLKYSDFIFLTSHYECNSMLALEVMACGGLLLSKRSCNLTDLFNSNSAIMLNNNPKKASKQILKLFQNKSKMKQTRTNAIDFTKKFNFDTFEKKISKLYNDNTN